jgi:hypothetical protein
VDILHASLIALVDSIEYMLAADTSMPKEAIFPSLGR